MPQHVAELLNQPLSDSPWGALLAVYFVLVGVPSGLTLVVQWARIRYPDRGWHVARTATWVSLVIACLAGVFLVIDLGRPERFFLMITRFDNLTSPISLVAKILALKVFLLVADLYLTRGNSSQDSFPTPADRLTRLVDRVVRLLLVVSSVALAIYPVAVLSRTWMAPLAGTSGAGLLYLVTALLSGVAAYLVIEACSPVRHAEGVGPGLRVVAFGLLVVYLVAMVFEWIIISGDPTLRDEVPRYLSGTGGAALFWAGAVGTGVVLSVVGLAQRRSARPVRVAAAVCLVTGAAVVRFLIFDVGP